MDFVATNGALTMTLQHQFLGDGWYGNFLTLNPITVVGEVDGYEFDFAVLGSSWHFFVKSEVGVTPTTRFRTFGTTAETPMRLEAIDILLTDLMQLYRATVVAFQVETG